MKIFDFFCPTALKAKYFVLNLGMSLLFVFANGCASIATMADSKEYKYDEPAHHCADSSSHGLIFGGVRADAAIIGDVASGQLKGHAVLPDPLFLIFAIFDMPLSFGIDTVILPVTVPWASYRHFHRNTLAKKVQKLTIDDEIRLRNANIDRCEFVDGRESPK